MKNMRIGEYLVDKGFITELQLREVLAMQKNSNGKKFGDIIIESGFMSDTTFTKALAGRFGVPFVDLSSIPVDKTAVTKIPEHTAKKYNIIAISIQGSRINIATNDPVDFFAMEDIKVITGMDCNPLLATKNDIFRAINKYYSIQTIDNVVENATNQFEPTMNAELQNIEDSLQGERIENAPIVKLATTIIESSFRAEATDIHIEPFKTSTKIRIRVNGDMVELMQVSNIVHTSLVTRFKIISGMNIAEKRVPQDGRFTQKVDATTLDVRVSSLPTINGEKIVIRILSTGDVSVRKITDLGMNSYNYQLFETMLKVPQGVILVTGPTGSGKTTTLYAALGELAKPNVNVITVEDPVEKNIEGINQCQVNPKAGMTFAAALRAILRQDPDIVMIGEMRDQETSEIAIRAAITGHLVLSTLHTNDAATTITRLVDMGVAPYMVASSLIGVVSQRLVKILCPHCKNPRPCSKSEAELLGVDSEVTIHEAIGCKQCNYTGYKSRTAIHEILLVTPDISNIIANGGNSNQIAQAAKQNGTKLLKENVAELVLNGVTTIDELIRVAYSI